MKKYLLTAFLLTALGLAGFSQSGVFAGGMGNRTLRETGWKIRPEMGIAYVRYPFITISANIGHQITPHFYLGGGMACFVNPIRTYDSYSGLYGRDNVESLYANFRWYCLDGRISPFLELDLGIGRYDNPFDDDYYYSYYGYYDYNEYQYNNSVKTLPFLTLAVGCDIKNFEFKFGAGNYGYDHVGLWITLGYNFMIKKR